MQNKSLISIALLGLCSAFPLNAAITADQQQEEVVLEVEEIGYDENADNFTAVLAQSSSADAALSEAAQKEFDRKAKQQEKARNAAENDSWGGAITLIAMCIVILALAILSLLFYFFGKISTYTAKSRKRKAHGVTSKDAQEHHEELDSGEVIAAISMALAEHMGQGHDIEDTILTIRRMRKAYSPWNSKIYNLRVVPAHTEARAVRGLNRK